jgi:hypothetical protein
MGLQHSKSQHLHNNIHIFYTILSQQCLIRIKKTQQIGSNLLINLSNINILAQQKKEPLTIFFLHGINGMSLHTIIGTNYF